MDPKTNTSKFNRYQAEAVIPWVNDVVLYLTIALQTAQQLKDKVIRCLNSLCTLPQDIVNQYFQNIIIKTISSSISDQCFFTVS